MAPRLHPRRDCLGSQQSLETEWRQRAWQFPRAAGKQHAKHPSKDSDDESLDLVERLQNELERTLEEKQLNTGICLQSSLQCGVRWGTSSSKTLYVPLHSAYFTHSVTQEEFDQREKLVQWFSAQNDDLTSTVETLRAELIYSHEENERVSSELDSMCPRAYHKVAQESLIHERSRF
jgi:hypothetical protein